MNDLGDEVVSVVRAPMVSDHGSQVENWSGTLTVTPVEGCSVQPGVGREDLAHRDAILVAYTVFLPFGTDVTGRNRLRIRGHDHPIIGDPDVWPDNDPEVAHIKAFTSSWRDLT